MLQLKPAVVFVACLCWVVSSSESSRAEEERIPVLVMDFSSKEGLSGEQVDALSDLLTAQIASFGPFRVIGKNDIEATLRLEERRALLGCDTTSCFAELGGALGARWVVIGNAGLFANHYLLNLKILDSEQVRLVASVARKIDDHAALMDGLGEAVHALFSRAAKDTGFEPPPLVEKPAHPYQLWGHVSLWSGLGFLALGGVSAGLAAKYGQDFKSGALAAERKSEAMTGLMWTGFGLGAALVTTGLVLWAMEPEDRGDLVLGGAPAPGAGFVFCLGGSW